MPGPGTWVLPHSIMGTKRRPSSDTRAASDLPPTSFQLLPICQRAVQLGQNPYGTRVIAAHITLRYSQNCVTLNFIWRVLSPSHGGTLGDSESSELSRSLRHCTTEAPAVPCMCEHVSCSATMSRRSRRGRGLWLRRGRARDLARDQSRSSSRILRYVRYAR